MAPEKKYTFTQWMKILSMIGCTLYATGKISKDLGALIFKGNTWYNGMMVAIENRKNMDSLQNILIRDQHNDMLNLNNKIEAVDLRVTNCELDVNKIQLRSKK